MAPRSFSPRSFTQGLRQKAAPLWEQEQSHPFLLGLGDGTLPLDRFRYYMRQDYVFLVDFCRVVALAAAKAGRVEDMAWFARLLHETLNAEMAMHVSFCGDLGITEAELKSTAPSPTTVAYTGYLLRIAHSGDVCEAAVAILPCSWGYAEIGRMLTGRGLPKQRLYRRWIEQYASPEFAALDDQLRAFIDRQAPSYPASRLRELEQVFLQCSRYEYLFWDAAYRMEAWPS
ncbi:MAG: thiaminase II [SAR202 cluster bacterium]|nr:thiaminase II [SAR202 cluster bacterium]